MTVKALFDKYCKIEDGEYIYIVHGHRVTLEPATEEDLESFKKLCAEYNVDQRMMTEISLLWIIKRLSITELLKSSAAVMIISRMKS